MSTPEADTKYMNELMKIITEMFKTLFKKSFGKPQYSKKQIEAFYEGVVAARDEIAILTNSKLNSGSIDKYNDASMKTAASVFAGEFQIATLDAVADIVKKGGDLEDLPSAQELGNRAMVSIHESLVKMGKEENFNKIIHSYEHLKKEDIESMVNSTNSLIKKHLGDLGMDAPTSFVAMACNKCSQISVDIANNQTPKSPDQQKNPELYELAKKDIALNNDFEMKARSSNPDEPEMKL
jgi:hypothetical protein